MLRIRTLLLLGAAAITLRSSDASAQMTRVAPPWWSPPFVVWYSTSPASPPPPVSPAPPPPVTPASAHDPSLVVPIPPYRPTSGDAWPKDWAKMEEEVFALTNARRAQGAVCGGKSFAPARPLVPDSVLRTAARDHSRDMGAANYFEHVSLDGRSPVDRMHSAGWSGKTGGENIYGGHEDGAPMSAEKVVEGWMESPGHCSNIMDPRFKTLGVGFAAAPESKLKNYWTQDFGG